MEDSGECNEDGEDDEGGSDDSIWLVTNEKKESYCDCDFDCDDD